MSDPKKDAEATTQDNHMPAPPSDDKPLTASGETARDATVSGGSADETIRPMDNHMPVPPALGGGGE